MIPHTGDRGDNALERPSDTAAPLASESHLRRLVHRGNAVGTDCARHSSVCEQRLGPARRRNSRRLVDRHRHVDERRGQSAARSSRFPRVSPAASCAPLAGNAGKWFYRNINVEMQGRLKYCSTSCVGTQYGTLNLRILRVFVTRY